jgi:hypothetical protein
VDWPRSIGVAGEDGQAWMRSRGIVPIVYGDGIAERLRQAALEAGGAPNALIDTVGQGYVELAIELGIDPQRVDTIVDNEAAAKYGAKTDGQGAASGTEVVEEMVALLAAGEVELPIAASFPLDQVREAYTLLENGHPPGKIVLIP